MEGNTLRNRIHRNEYDRPLDLGQNDQWGVIEGDEYDENDERLVEMSIPSTPAEEEDDAENEYPAFTSSSKYGPATASGYNQYITPSSPEDRPSERVEDEQEAPMEEEACRPADDESLQGEGVEEGERDDRQCRICFAGAEEEDSLGRLISPCLCTGSMRYVHVQCINAWRGTGTNSKAFMECPQCHHQYRLRRTLASGLATSRLILFILSTILFTVITILTGTALHALLAYSSSTRRKLLTASTLFDTEAIDTSHTTWTTAGGETVIIMGVGGNFMWDVTVSAIQTFTRIALEFADLTQDWTENILGDIFFDLGIRFILGLAVLGSFSFISLLFSISLFGPFHIFNTVRGIGFLRNWTRGGREGRGRGSGVGQAMIILFVLIGTANTLWSVYRMVNGITQRVLVYVEAQILEVNPEMRQQEKEKRERRAREGWVRRWIRNGGWKTGWGWWELLVRFGYAMKDLVRHRWEVAKEGWRRGLGEVDI